MLIPYVCLCWYMSEIEQIRQELIRRNQLAKGKR